MRIRRQNEQLPHGGRHFVGPLAPYFYLSPFCAKLSRGEKSKEKGMVYAAFRLNFEYNSVARCDEKNRRARLL